MHQTSSDKSALPFKGGWGGGGGDSLLLGFMFLPTAFKIKIPLDQPGITLIYPPSCCTSAAATTKFNGRSVE
jgi:hypothetical protein